MQPSEEDAALLWDMLEAARAVGRFVNGLTMGEYLGNELVKSAVERQIEIIGEAARRVSSGLRSAHPEIPWARIVGQRHVLAHDYGRIEHDRIWNVVTVHIPELIVVLEAALSPPSASTDVGN